MSSKPENAGGDSADEPDITESQVQSEIQEYLSVRQQRRRLFPRAALVGLLAGVVASLFRATLAMGDSLRNSLISVSHRVPTVGVLIPILVCGIVASASVYLVRRFAPEASGSGIPHLEAVLHRL